MDKVLIDGKERIIGLDGKEYLVEPKEADQKFVIYDRDLKVIEELLYDYLKLMEKGNEANDIADKVYIKDGISLVQGLDFAEDVIEDSKEELADLFKAVNESVEQINVGKPNGQDDYVPMIRLQQIADELSDLGWKGETK